MGSKVTKVAEKVATDTAEDLRKAAGSFEGVIPGKPHHSLLFHYVCSEMLFLGYKGLLYTTLKFRFVSISETEKNSLWPRSGVAAGV